MPDSLAPSTGLDADTRERLSPAAIRAFVQLATLWKLTEVEQLALLGESVGRSTLYEWRKGSVRAALNQDQLMRTSYLLGIYEGLQRIWRSAPDTADTWVRRPLAATPFRGKDPLAYMIAGGIPAMADTRAFVDAANFGPPSREWYPAPSRES